MSQLLDQAIAQLRQLPEAEQDAMAALVLAEIEDERQWEASFERSAETLEAMAARAAEQVRAGQCRAAGFDEL